MVRPKKIYSISQRFFRVEYLYLGQFSTRKASRHSELKLSVVQQEVCSFCIFHILSLYPSVLFHWGGGGGGVSPCQVGPFQNRSNQAKPHHWTTSEQVRLVLVWMWSDLLCSVLACSDMFWPVLTWSDMVWACLMWFELVCCGMTCFDVVWPVLTWSDVIRPVLMWSDMVSHVLTWSDAFWPVLRCSDLFWCGLTYSDMA